MVEREARFDRSAVGAPRLGDLLRRSEREIARAWVLAVRAAQPPARRSTRLVLEDQIATMIARIADLADAEGASELWCTAEGSIVGRLEAGFDLEAALRELAALRDCILALWLRDGDGPGRGQELSRVNLAVDRAVAALVQQYTETQRRTLLIAQSELRESEETLRLAVEAAHVGTWDYRPIAGTLRCCARLREIFGIPAGAPVSYERMIEATHPQDRAAVDGESARALDPTSGRFDAEYRIVRPGGEVRWVVVKGRAFFEGRGQRTRAVRLIGTVLDVTERRRAEDLDRFLGDATAVLGSSLDVGEMLTSVARAAVPAFADWCSVEVVDPGGALRRLAIVHADPEKVDLVERLLSRRSEPLPCTQRALETCEPQFMERITSEGLSLIAEGPDDLAMLRGLGVQSYLAVPLAARPPVFGVITFASAESGHHYDEHDLDTAAELARRLAIAVDNARLYEETQRAVRIREEILAVVSHDLKNPLGAILMASALMRRDIVGPGSPALKFVETIHRAAGRMDFLIRDLLDMASLQAGRLALEPQPTQAAALVAEAIEKPGRLRRREAARARERRGGRRRGPVRSQPDPAGARQPHRQRDQVLRGLRSDRGPMPPPPEGGAVPGQRHGARDPGAGPATGVRTVLVAHPAPEERDGAGALHLPRHRASPRRPDLGRERARARHDRVVHAAARRLSAPVGYSGGSPQSTNVSVVSTRKFDSTVWRSAKKKSSG
jgi:PAS domain S-box-containing protein